MPKRGCAKVILERMLTGIIFREAIRAVRRNKMRSSLTVLGVTIGIGAVICVVALGTA